VRVRACVRVSAFVFLFSIFPMGTPPSRQETTPR
jgi:hypothetical protein